MYHTATNSNIGQYLEKLISAQYNSDRQFAIAYLKEQNKTSEPAPEDIQKMANKICQIKKGNKGIQITDLPIFSGLLGVSVDSILSAGKLSSASPSRVSNYSIATTKDKDEIKRYIDRPDKPFLNADEFGKTILDYVFEFKNYDLLKFMMDEGYIWFVGKNSSNYVLTFDAGTSIKRRSPHEMDKLIYEIGSSDQLRTNMIALAVENNDYEVLNELHAREIPELYLANSIGGSVYELDRYYNRTLIKAVSESSDAVLKYFSEEFVIQSNGLLKQKYTFTFPYLGKLIDEVVKKNPKAAPVLLKNAIKHNKNVITMLNRSAEASLNGFLDGDSAKYWPIEEARKNVMSYFYYHKKNDTVSLFPRYTAPGENPGVFSNIIRVTATSKDNKLQSLINDVNKSYDAAAKYTFSAKCKNASSN